jgi:hypothetical protein
MAGWHRYKLADGTAVPSVTTVVKQLGGSAEGLIRWAHRLGLDGKDLDEARQTAMSIGTVAHAMIEAHLGKEPLDTAHVPIDILEGAKRAFDMFVEWAELTRYTVVAKETPLVSETHRFGGRFDCVLVQGRRVLADWKTSTGIYTEHLVQVAAYGALWNENRPGEPIEGYILLRLGKDQPLFDHHYRPANGEAMEDAWKAFLHCRALHDLSTRLKKAA